MDWISVLIGGAITLLVSGVFYVLAARDLKKEASELRRYNRLLVELLDEYGFEVGRDEHGNPTGVVRKGSAEISGSAKMSANPRVGEEVNDDDNPRAES